MMLRHIFLGAAVLALSFGVPKYANAQEEVRQPISSPILVVDSDRVFRASGAGKQINADLEKQLQTLVSENRRIEAELIAEELALTEQRPDLTVSEFRELADAFDVKVQAIRQDQDAKQRELQQLRATQDQTFLDSIAPILTQIGRERGALAILERRSVLLSAGNIDITDEAIQRINDLAENTANPDGQTLPEPVETPENVQ